MLAPIVAEQVYRLESLVRDIEKVSFHLTSSKHTTALTASSHHSSLSSHHAPPVSTKNDTSNPLGAAHGSSGSNDSYGGGYNSGSGVQPSRNKTPSKRSNSIRNLIEFTPGVARQLDNGNGTVVGESIEETPARSKNDFTSITDALVQIEALRQELERVQMGLTLMCFSVEKLMDIVTTEPACCPSIFDFLIPRTQQSIGRDSTGLYTVNSSSSAGRPYASGGNSTHSTADAPSQSASSRMSGRMAAAGPTTLFKNHKIKQAGYTNISANPSTIGSTDDDDEI